MAKTEVWLTAHQVPSVPGSSDSESVKRSAPCVDQLSSFAQTQTAHFFLCGIYEEASELVYLSKQSSANLHLCKYHMSFHNLLPPSVSHICKVQVSYLCLLSLLLGASTHESCVSGNIPGFAASLSSESVTFP